MAENIPTKLPLEQPRDSSRRFVKRQESPGDSSKTPAETVKTPLNAEGKAGEKQVNAEVNAPQEKLPRGFTR